MADDQFMVSHGERVVYPHCRFGDQIIHKPDMLILPEGVETVKGL